MACLAWPLHAAYEGEMAEDKLSLIFLLRLFRLKNIVILMDLQKFTALVR